MCNIRFARAEDTVAHLKGPQHRTRVQRLLMEELVALKKETEGEMEEEEEDLVSEGTIDVDVHDTAGPEEEEEEEMSESEVAAMSLLAESLLEDESEEGAGDAYMEDEGEFDAEEEEEEEDLYEDVEGGDFINATRTGGKRAKGKVKNVAGDSRRKGRIRTKRKQQPRDDESEGSMPMI